MLETDKWLKLIKKHACHSRSLSDNINPNAIGVYLKSLYRRGALNITTVSLHRSVRHCGLSRMMAITQLKNRKNDILTCFIVVCSVTVEAVVQWFGTVSQHCQQLFSHIIWHGDHRSTSSLHLCHFAVWCWVLRLMFEILVCLQQHHIFILYAGSCCTICHFWLFTGQINTNQ